MNINLSPFKALKVPAILASVFVIALLAYYYFWVSGKTTYLEGRNFRLLATVGRQIDESIETQAQVIRSILLDNKEGKRWEEKRDELKKRVADFDKDSNRNEGACKGTDQTVYLEREAGRSWVRVRICDGNQYQSVRFSLDKLLQNIFGETAKQAAFGSVLLAKTNGEVVYQSAASEQKLTRLDKLMPVGSAKAPPTFAALAYATNSFTAELSGASHYFFVQPCCQSLRANDPAQPLRPSAGVVASSVADNTADADTALAQTSASPTTAANKPPRAEEKPAEALVLCGIVSARRMTYGSMEISFTLLALITGIILAAIFSWPFLKLSLIGERQRVQLLDVLLVGSCAVLLLALLTLTGLDVVAYHDFKTGLNKNLESLAEQIKQEALGEVSRSYTQLAWMEEMDKLAHSVPAPPPQQPPLPARPLLPTYAPFTEFFLVTKDGQQFGKHPMIPGTENPAINVADRAYFQQVLKDHTWPAPDGSRVGPPQLSSASAGAETNQRYVLESIRSWTSGNRRAVMIKPSASSAASAATQDAKARAAGTGLRLRSLIGPVVAFGFGFAVIDEDGKVLFHSDEQRNLIENFFAEADGDRRLRAAVAAHREDHVQIRYGGQDYAAFVTPLGRKSGLPWHVVTFYDKQLPRTLNIEWLVTTVLLLSCYALIFVVFGAIVMALHPDQRAPWLWPDQARLHRYLKLLWLYLLPAALLITLIWRSPVGWWPLVGLAASLACVWGLTAALLWPAPKAAATEEPSWKTGWRSRRALISAYSAFWVAHLFLVAVLPTVVFFQIAHRVHTDAYLKYTQLHSARILQERQTALAGELTEAEITMLSWCKGKDAKWCEVLAEQWCQRKDPSQACHQLSYEERIKRALRATTPPAIFYGADLIKRVTDVRVELKDDESLLPSPGGLALPSLLEDSPFSVQLKQMARASNASDGAWVWKRGKENSRYLLLSLPAEPQSASLASDNIRLEATAPLMLTNNSANDIAMLLVTALTIALLLWWLTRFACKRIFLIDLMPPVWRDAKGRLQVSGGYHTFIVDRDGGSASEYGVTVDFNFKVWQPSTNQLEWRAQVGRLMERKPRGVPVVLDHFEEEMHNAYFTGQKLDVIEELIRVHNRTVIVLTAVHPAPLFAYYQTPVMIGEEKLDGAHARRWQTLSAFSVIDMDPSSLALGAADATELVAPINITAAAAPPLASNGNGAAATTIPEADAAVMEAGAPANRLKRALTAPFKRPSKPRGRDALPEEFRHSRLLTGLVNEVSATNGNGRRRIPSRDVVEEVNDRAARYYYELWSSCTPAEKTVLVHLAQDGFLNDKDRRTIRRLMMRGLIVRAPHLRLESKALRNFLLTRTCRMEAAKLAAAPRSDWDSFKWPFIVVLAAVVLFFFATQQELFNATVAVITGLAGSVPMIIRVVGLLFGKRQQTEEQNK